nr:hypothetical protein [Akkermansia muciniphila]
MISGVAQSPIRDMEAYTLELRRRKTGNLMPPAFAPDGFNWRPDVISARFFHAVQERI